MGDFGWSAEFRIPFKTIRYPKRDDQSWGVNFQRNITAAQRKRLLVTAGPAIQYFAAELTPAC